MAHGQPLWPGRNGEALVGRSMTRNAGESMDVAELARLLDHAALEAGDIEESPVFDDVCMSLDGEDIDAAVNGIMQNALRSLLSLMTPEKMLECGHVVKTCRDELLQSCRRHLEQMERGAGSMQSCQREYEYRLAGLFGFDAWLCKRAHPEWSLEKVRRAVVQLHRADLARMGWFSTAVKALHAKFPDIDKGELSDALQEIPDLAWSHRARVSEAMKELSREFPEIEPALILDRRGGDRDVHGCVSAEQLLADYQAMRDEERAKPPSERCRVKGPGGIFHKLACRYGIRGNDGKPSWMEVHRRIYRHKKKCR